MPLVVYRFGDFSLDCGKFELCRKGHRLKLERKPLELLVVLVTKHGQVVTRDEIAGCLWQREVFVDIEHGINTAIRKIRQILDDSSDLPQFVHTISGSGYRFIAPVTAVEPEVTEPTQPSGDPVDLPPPPPEVSATPVIPSAGKPHHRVWLVTALCASVLVVTSILTLGPPPLAARFLDRDTHAPIASLAVLPLANLSGDPDEEYFADGMTDELTTMLAKDSTLRIVSRTSAMQFKGAHRSLPEIARALSVDAILEGSISRSGNQVHMTLQLVRGDTDSHQWAESYDRDTNDVAARCPTLRPEPFAARLNSSTPTPATSIRKLMTPTCVATTIGSSDEMKMPAGTTGRPLIFSPIMPLVGPGSGRGNARPQDFSQRRSFLGGRCPPRIRDRRIRCCRSLPIGCN